MAELVVPRSIPTARAMWWLLAAPRPRGGLWSNLSGMHSGLWLSAVLSTSRLATLSLMGSTFAEGDPFRAPQVICDTRRGVRRRAPHAARRSEPPRRTGSCDVSRTPRSALRTIPPPCADLNPAILGVGHIQGMTAIVIVHAMRAREKFLR